MSGLDPLLRHSFVFLWGWVGCPRLSVFLPDRRETCLNRRMEPFSEEIGGIGQHGPKLDSLLARPAGQRPPSEEVLASLAAIQAARVAVELRLQRDSLRVRLMTMAFLAVFAGGTFALAAHLRARRHPRAATGPVAVATTPPGPTAAGPALAPTSEVPLGIDFEHVAPTAASRAPAIDAVPGSVAAAGVTSPAEPATAAEREQALAACHDAYDRHRWRAAAETCSLAFEASPNDAALAMKAAQSQHARGHYAEAGELARRAIALEDAESRGSGHPGARRTARPTSGGRHERVSPLLDPGATRLARRRGARGVAWRARRASRPIRAPLRHRPVGRAWAAAGRGRPVRPIASSWRAPPPISLRARLRVP